jgi:hypothetical protein
MRAFFSFEIARLPMWHLPFSLTFVPYDFDSIFFSAWRFETFDLNHSKNERALDF